MEDLEKPPCTVCINWSSSSITCITARVLVSIGLLHRPSWLESFLRYSCGLAPGHATSSPKTIAVTRLSTPAWLLCLPLPSMVLCRAGLFMPSVTGRYTTGLCWSCGRFWFVRLRIGQSSRGVPPGRSPDALSCRWPVHLCLINAKLTMLDAALTSCNLHTMGFQPCPSSV